MNENELLKIAIEYLVRREGCPTYEDFQRQNKDCENCSEDQDLSKCWRNYLEFSKEEH